MGDIQLRLRWTNASATDIQLVMLSCYTILAIPPSASSLSHTDDHVDPDTMKTENPISETSKTLRPLTL